MTFKFAEGKNPATFELSHYIISLGCSKNLVDSERINGEMIAFGFTLAESSEDADIIIINTCGFINPAKEESIEVILDAVELQGDGKKIAVTGCLSSRYFDDIKNDIPEINFLYGIPDDNFVVSLCSSLNIKIPDNSDDKSSRKPISSNIYSYIKIAEGCSNNCSYCAIPLIRGPHQSFSHELVLKDAREAVEMGAKELVVIAQDIALYKDGGFNLVGIVNEISKIEEIQWIRLMYCHPDHLSDEIIRLIADNPKVVRYLDIPFQHASKKILEAMGRKGSFESYLKLIEKIRKIVPGIKIRSTFMVGFPGEDEDDFSQLKEFVQRAKIDRLGVFTYSDEEGTEAFKFLKKVSEDIKQKRFDELMGIQQDISIEKMNSLIGIEMEVIVEEKVEENTYIGRSEFDAPEVDGVFYLTSTENIINSIVKARVLDAVEYDLIGETL